jgi:hypothetical protein
MPIAKHNAKITTILFIIPCPPVIYSTAIAVSSDYGKIKIPSPKALCLKQKGRRDGERINSKNERIK